MILDLLTAGRIVIIQLRVLIIMLRSVWFKLIRILITNSIILIAFPLQAVCNSLLLILLLLLLVLFQLTYPITIIRLVLIAISLL